MGPECAAEACKEDVQMEARSKKQGCLSMIVKKNGNRCSSLLLCFLRCSPRAPVPNFTAFVAKREQGHEFGFLDMCPPQGFQMNCEPKKAISLTMCFS
jgi:hypothetical protein